ncbi:hypothetical protein HQ343_15925 [Rhodococcus sp. BP-154]|uniref:hypothetical protein n=1 Tax=Nocardiaceae TaxID=85025 RepID=UPI0008394053|nr:MULTISPECIES: hypothetical protein [Rhodococcus]MBY6536017.1 hypothetical protein [Rhodococcus sp. BP-148]MBY6568064.1 hypothetical protein [Rhodococcus sp. BP-154]
MKSQRWFESRRIELWLSAIVLVCLVGGVGPSVVGAVVSVGAPWNWFKLAVWACVVVGFVHTFVKAWRGRQSPGAVLPDPDVSVADVERIVSSEPNRVAAVKALRQQHPGLKLKDAADLVDAARATRGPEPGP